MICLEKSISSQALGTHHMCFHLVLLGPVQCKPGLTNWACSGQAQAALDGSTCAVYPAPDGAEGEGFQTSLHSFYLQQSLTQWNGGEGGQFLDEHC